MKALVTGVTGQLGYDVARELEKRHIEYKGLALGTWIFLIRRL